MKVDHIMAARKDSESESKNKSKRRGRGKKEKRGKRRGGGIDKCSHRGKPLMTHL